MYFSSCKAITKSLLGLDEYEYYFLLPVISNFIQYFSVIDAFINAKMTISYKSKWKKDEFWYVMTSITATFISLNYFHFTLEIKYQSLTYKILKTWIEYDGV